MMLTYPTGAANAARENAMMQFIAMKSKQSSLPPTLFSLAQRC